MRLAAFVLATLSFAPSLAFADNCSDNPRARAGFLFGGATGDDDTEIAYSGSFGIRIDRCIGLELEVSLMPDFQGQEIFYPLLTRNPAAIGIGNYIPYALELEGRAVSMLALFRVEVPTTVSRMVPFIVGGGGITNIQREFDYTILADPRRLAQGNSSFTFTSASGQNTSISSAAALLQSQLIYPPVPASSSRSDLTLAIGGGVSFRLVKQLWFDADLRYIRIFAEPEINVNRFSAGASYRF